MRSKACKRCGRSFTPPSKYTYLCPECHEVAKTSGVVRDRQCRMCGSIFQGGPRAWYCQDCRAERQREQNSRFRKTGSARKLGSIDLCTRCGGEYVVASGRQKYCPVCSGEAVAQTVRAHKRQYAADHAEQMAKYKSAMSRDRHVCIICGTVFDSDRPKATCSDACDKIRIHRQQQAADAKRRPRKRR